VPGGSRAPRAAGSRAPRAAREPRPARRGGSHNGEVHPAGSARDPRGAALRRGLLCAAAAGALVLPASGAIPALPARVTPSARASAAAYPIPAPPVLPEPCPPPPLPPGPPPPPLGPPSVPDSAIPVAGVPPPRVVDLSALSGKGLWLTTWKTSRLDVRRTVAMAVRAGLRQLWLRTGSSHDGYYGATLLRELVPAAHRAGIAVIAWDFATMSNPAADAARAADALRDGADGFAADIESPAEGTYLSARRVAYYLSLVRADAGRRPVVAVVPRPLRYWLATYPYAAEAPYVDAFAPMVYWSCTEPGRAVLEAIRGLERLRPVVPVGQDYDMASEGGRHGLPSGAEIWRFLDVSHRGGALGASLYDAESGGPAQLAALARYPWRERSLG